MSSLLRSVFSGSLRPESDALPEFQADERGERSTSQVNETPFPSPVDSHSPMHSSSRLSLSTPNARRQQGEHGVTGMNPPLMSPSGSRPEIEFAEDVMTDVSNALEKAALKEAQKRESQSEPEPLHNGKRTRRGKRSKHFPGIHFKVPRLPSRLERLNPSLVLENSGSVARDHLASERTFLAYVRTSLALASMGVAIVQLFTIADLASAGSDTKPPAASKKVQRFARPLGVTTVILGLVVLFIAVFRYFIIQRALPDKMFPVARFSIAFLSFALGAVVVVIFAALLSGGSSS
ncbi:hypothetical protein CPB84DRAFT_1774867 [Gymnopilus junonius]|uniref:DUF202 domain-containing protein n=1 Tax=Gymnopilus junonius TaxID=109634 RepID=A0A9P5TNE9_GYMJU|nr:hypothetical protein CPB84DRAFT_1774867 [Gymnopilus junonius]